jgi:hypothetical protein
VIRTCTPPFGACPLFGMGSSVFEHFLGTLVIYCEFSWIHCESLRLEKVCFV